MFSACSGDSRTKPKDPGANPATHFPQILRFEPSRTTVKRGQTVELAWEVTDADTIEIATGVLPPSRELIGVTTTAPLEQTTSFTLKAKSSIGESTRVVTVTVGTGTDVEITGFTATPTITPPGGTVTLSWTVERATRVALSVEGGAELDANAPLISTRVVNPVDSTIYVITAEGPGGPVTERVFIEVGKVPSIQSFTATPDAISRGDSSTLSWEVVGATGVAILDDRGQTIHQSAMEIDSFEVTPSLTTEYTLIANNQVGAAQDRATVRVNDGGTVEITEFTVTPTQLTRPGDVMIRWATRGADMVGLTGNRQPVAGFPGAASGDLTVSVQQTTQFALIASGPAGTESETINVVVQMQADATPPVITHTPVLATQVAGADVTISAAVSDADAGVATVTLFHRVAGTTPFAQVMLTNDGAGNYAGAIPGTAVSIPSIEYYIEAIDAAASPNKATSPATAPLVLHGFGVSAADTAPPMITHTPVADGQLAGSAVTVQADIVDTGSGVNTAVLFYRLAGAAQFSMASMTSAGGNTYAATVPMASVQTPAVEYYVAATDGASPANTASLPAGAPGATFRFTVSPLDQQAPQITHTQVTNGQTANGAVLVTAQVTDPSGVGGVSLYYRTQGGASFTVLSMTAAMATYSASIPGTAVQAPGVEYYVEARDAASTPNTGTLPASAPATPFTFSVTVVDTNPPTIVHNPITGAQAPGGAVTLTAEVTDASGVASVSLSYRLSGQTQFTSVPMTGGPTFTAMIPANAVNVPAIQYYLQAADSASPSNAGTLPNGAPTAFYTFVVGVEETEANDTAATADVLLGNGMLTNVGLGALTPVGEYDWWLVDVPAGATLYNLEIETTVGGVGNCPAPADTVVRIYAADGTTQLATDSIDGVGSCSKIDPRDDDGAVALSAGRYYVRLEESGRNAVVGAYEVRGRLFPTECGNGIHEAPANEQCDDGNTTAGDGCSATCMIEPDGVAMAPGATFTGAISPAGDRDIYALDLTQGQNIVAEVTDGMGGCPGDSFLDLYGPDGSTVLGTDDDDGVSNCSAINARTDTWAANLDAGRYFLRVRGFGASTVLNSYVLSISISDGICGNGTIETGEVCDDNNSRSADGCSATCQWETAGMANGMGGSFMGAIDPVGNIDWYAVTVQQGDSIRAETFAPADGQCATGNDTLLRLYAANRTTQITSDDQGGIQNCSLIDPASNTLARNLAAGTYYVAVEEFLNNGTLAAYVLDVQILTAGCGNGWIDGADQCDDGNTTVGDGCNATCQFEGPGEMEPNDTSAMANVLVTGTATVGTVYGALSSGSDVDIYSIVVPAGYHVHAEVSDGNGGCSNDANVRLRGTDGTTSLAYDTTDGPGSCGQITPQNDTGARGLAAGTYFLEVTGSGGAAAYVLTVRLLAPGCGDAFLDMGEQCDDGNMMGGDGCSAMCQLEGIGEVEPNDTNATANAVITNAMTTPSAQVTGVIADASDEDNFSVVVPAGWHIIAEISDGAGGCPNDGDLRLLSPTGTQLVSDTRDGPQDCGRISAGLDTAARGLAAGTYVLEVQAAAGRTEVYTLSVRVVAPNICGNLLLDTTEQCDDGNAAAGDGCSATCQYETVEVEPNNDRLTATPIAAGPMRTVSASIGVNGDDDWFAVTVTAGQSLAIFTHTGAFDECASTQDTVVELYQPDGVTTLTSDDDDGPSVCSAIDRVQAANLAAGTYLVRVRPYWSNRTFDYALTVRTD